MLIGFSTTPWATPRRWCENCWPAGTSDYVELLIDNFLAVPIEALMDGFAAPVGFHIMFSKFIENDTPALERLAHRLRGLIDRLRPLYVSDHVARFRPQWGASSTTWQRSTTSTITRESANGSTGGNRHWAANCCWRTTPRSWMAAHDAPAFHERLYRDTGAGVLFDASNAVCAHLNCGVPLEAWEGIIESSSALPHRRLQPVDPATPPDPRHSRSGTVRRHPGLSPALPNAVRHAARDHDLRARPAL